MPWRAKDAAPFLTRFELRYSLDEALRHTDRRSRYQASLVDSKQSWTRLIVFTFLASGLSYLALAAGALSKGGLPLVALLLGAAFLGGFYAAGLESGSMTKRIVRMMHAQGTDLGPWDVVISDKALEASGRGRSFRLDLAAIQSVALDDTFVVLMIDPGEDFYIPKRCLGDDRAAEAFKSFIEAQRGRSATSERT